MKQTLDLSSFSPKSIRPLGKEFQGESRDGHRLSCTNYYLELDGAPFYAISGEFHFSRMQPERWEDELMKCRLGGVNTISTYVFWIHHEEEEGRFRFDGRRDIRRFVTLCRQQGLKVILRVGPFDHGEVRNGGYPDWLYGKPFDIRALNEGYLNYVRRLYTAIAEEVKGLFWKDGGPVIGVQIDNEYMHSSAPWERTTGISNEWVPGGHEGNAYMERLRDLAAECGLQPVFYTCTGWGGAATPDSMLPLWGGYAFRPWIFYSHKGEHPATDEYLYRDYHNNATAADFGEDPPAYSPEDRPYSCCEMGGGMMCSYYYRFQYPYKSVDAMANIKMASGCNFLGYYMYHGGSNPTGLHGLPMNEGQVSKISYDYQAALGEFGQERESYHRLRTMHAFATTFQDLLCRMDTVKPAGQSDLSPTDDMALRYNVRTDGRSGFLFLNNYQDHHTLPAKKDEAVSLKMPSGEEITFRFDLASDENAILPFHLDVEGMDLIWASAQPVTRILPEDGKEPVWVFLAPDGMTPRFVFAENVSVDGDCVLDTQPGAPAALRWLAVSDGTHHSRILLVNRTLANQLYILGGNRLLFTEAALLEDLTDGSLRIETRSAMNPVYMYPTGTGYLDSACLQEDSDLEGFDRYLFQTETISMNTVVEKVGESRWTITVPEDALSAVKDVLMQIDYQGDIGNLFLNGELINDNFYNGATWEYGLRDVADKLSGQGRVLTLYITPIREGANVNVESAMAGRMEEGGANIASLKDIRLQPLYEIQLRG